MQKPKPHIGLRHLALFVENIEECEKFYTEALGMDLFWKPDPDNVYLTSQGMDNLALHRAKPNSTPKDNQRLDHLGFLIEDIDEVDVWYEYMQQFDIKFHSQPKTHRDGARSFYCEDPAGNVVQMIYIPDTKR